MARPAGAGDEVVANAEPLAREVVVHEGSAVSLEGGPAGPAVRAPELDQLVRTRLRSLRTTLGLSLDDLARQTDLSASTISRLETGRRTISLDVLVPLARALQVSLDQLLTQPGDDDDVIRPTPARTGDHKAWVVSRATAPRTALRMQITPTRRRIEQRVHPGHDWFYVLSGDVVLHLGERDIRVATGEAAEFDTMIPHAITAHDGPAEVIMIFDRDGQRAHLASAP